MTDELHPSDGESPSPKGEDSEPPLLTKEEAIVEVKRWFARYKINPDQIFARTGDQVVRYSDLIPLLEQDTDEGRLLLRAISRGRVSREQRQFPGIEADDRK